MRNPSCPLCDAGEVMFFCQDNSRDYFRCSSCYLVFVPPAQLLSGKEEKARYDLHENSDDDPGYRKFLSRLFDPLNERLPAKSSGLDFGSGPGPTLSVMLEEAGHDVVLYDSFYAPDDAVFNKQYDFITATEVLEHLYDPKMELNRLWHCLKQRGRLGIMTKLVLDQEAFLKWHYKDESSHVCFFSRETFKWLAIRWQAELTFINEDVMIFQKNEINK